MELVIIFALTTLAKGITSANNTDSLYECTNGIIINIHRKCDGVNDCRNWDDECECAGLSSSLCEKRPCLNGNQQVRRRQLCDGIFDCDDLSDECLCDRVTNENQDTNALCDELIFAKSDICEVGSIPCSLFDGKGDTIACQNGDRICDGITDCKNEIDEKYCGKFDFLSVNSSAKTVCKNPIERNFNGSVTSGCMCDGVVDFPDGLDERNCSRYFYCSNRTDDFARLYEDTISGKKSSTFGDVEGIFIDWRRTFDGIQDCPDISDEWHGHFVYCTKTQIPTVSTEGDCPGHSRRRLASAEYAIKSRLFILLQWLIGFITMVANGAVVVLTISSLSHGSRTVDLRTRRANQVLVLSLSLSNFLLGVQMIAIGASDAVMRGEYWKYDLDWKSSFYCHAIGFLAITLTQVSILTVFVISALRLYTVIRPFSVIKVRYVALVSIIIWGVGMLAAKLPTLHSIPQVENYFINSVSIQNLPQVDATVVERNELNLLLQKSAVLHGIYNKTQIQYTPHFQDMNWRELETFLTNINPQFGEWQYFNYFAHTSMCLPTVIVNLGGYAWEYILVTIIVDVFAYGFVVVAYIIVMQKTATFKSHMCLEGAPSKESRGSVASLMMAARHHIMPLHKNNTNGETQNRRTSTMCKDRILKNTRDKENGRMQRRIFWLVFTDFICWAPIMLMNIINMIQPLNEDSLGKGLGLAFVLLQLNSMINPFIYSQSVRKAFFSIFSVPYGVIKNKLLPFPKDATVAVANDVDYAPCTTSNQQTFSAV